MIQSASALVATRCSQHGFSLQCGLEAPPPANESAVPQLAQRCPGAGRTRRMRRNIPLRNGTEVLVMRQTASKSIFTVPEDQIFAGPFDKKAVRCVEEGGRRRGKNRGWSNGKARPLLRCCVFESLLRALRRGGTPLSKTRSELLAKYAI